MENYGGKMELLRLSKFKLHLQSLISESQDLRERERSATEQLHRRIQKQKQSDEEYARKLQELEIELSSSNEQRQKLERKFKYIQSDNALLENKQKELKETIQNLIQSKEHFVNAYEESTGEMKRAIRIRDRKLGLLSEKLKSHFSLFDSIEKEAFSVKQVVESANRITSEKENLVADLKSKLDKVSSFEILFIEKICHLENKLNSHEDDIKRKNDVILELEARLETARVNSACQDQLDEIQKVLSSKDVIIQNLTSENEALHMELGSLRLIVTKVQENLANANGEDKGRFSSVLDGTRYTTDSKMDKRTLDLIKNSSAKCSTEAYDTGAVECTASSLSPKSDGIHLLKNNNMDSCASEISSISATTYNDKQSILFQGREKPHNGFDLLSPYSSTAQSRPL